MQKFSNARKHLERIPYRLSVAGNGLFLAGSVLYLTDSAAPLGTWAFVAGSALALLASVLPQLIQSWFCPADEDGDASSPEGGPQTSPTVAAAAA